RALELGWPVTQSYGMTETASQVAAQTVVAARSDPEGDLEILPHWHLTPAEEDRAILRGSALANGWLIPDGSSWLWEPLDPQQGLLTTDRLALREDGTRSYLRFLGRHGRRVKIKGEFVSLDEVEAHLRRLLPPDFPACTVVALPHARLGHELLWVLEADSPPNCAADLLRRYHTEQPTLPALTLCSLPHFPRSDLGKVRHTDLLQRLVETRR
ncbi:MAG: hypothetical protein KDK99_06945, partial [Verrucomicrobiales bacterium]|nr:hypothetical protein [Verrucomicrobiales bacterium]